jgi:DNA-directed RNA polymerase sigma subunit (sigma70/sigma32)
MAGERYDEIMRRRNEGETYQQIAARFGISRERVRQVI